MSSPAASKRFHALDLLRGLFIVIIIADHLSRWPSALGLLSGQGILWVTAAEGFVIISGLLVGYIRGNKAKDTSLRTVSVTLWRRALTLYFWAVLGSILYTAALWNLSLVGGAPGLPIEKGDWSALIIESITLHYTFLWVFFLKYYAIFLAAAPLAIWLLRNGKAWLVGLLSLVLLGIGSLTGNKVLEWQFVFFIPVIAGYYMPHIQHWWQRLTTDSRQVLATSIISLTFVTIALSAISAYLPEMSLLLDRVNTNVFTKDSMGLWRALMAFLWFTGYLLIFVYLYTYINRAFGWVLRPIGSHSLTAYIIHGLVIILISSVAPPTDNIVVNTLLGISAILLVWVSLKIPGINKVIPR